MVPSLSELGGGARQWLEGVPTTVTDTTQAFRPVPAAHTGTEQTLGLGTQDQGMWLLTGKMGQALAGKDQQPGPHRAGVLCPPDASPCAGPLHCKLVHLDSAKGKAGRRLEKFNSSLWVTLELSFGSLLELSTRLTLSPLPRGTHSPGQHLPQEQ